MKSVLWRLVLLLAAPISLVRADQIEMQNGDRYSGVVISMTPDTIVLQSEILGPLKVPRAKVSNIALGEASQAARPLRSTNNSSAVRHTAAAQPVDDTDAALKHLGASTNIIESIRKQFLADAGPQANQKFDDLLTGLMTGKLDMNDLRAQAKSAADQLRAMTKDNGGEGDETVQVYLKILDSFLAEGAPSATNSAQGTTIIR